MKRGERRAGPGPVSKKAWSGGRGVAGRALGCMQRMRSYAAAVIQGQRRGVCQRGSLKPGGVGSCTAYRRSVLCMLSRD